ncbi:3'-5' exonuclease [Ramlibacter sp. AN1133]|uniref:3'-5' exonuclease n=1 Tax=Ramlibacter sp. AN1133 TaxID=3133429 RepID=UPI0030C18CD2
MPLWSWHRPAVAEDRWLVVDVETSGLDAARDRLLAIAAIAVHADWRARSLAVRIADSFEVVVRQDAPSPRQNILLHGIGVQRQQQGVPAPEALQSFARFAGHSPLLAFHAAFDRALIGRHARAALGAALPNRWLDIEHLCAVTHPQLRARSLDEWLGCFHIHCAARHQAIADTLAECELLLRIWPRMATECASWRDVERLAARHRWVARA